PRTAQLGSGGRHRTAAGNTPGPVSLRLFMAFGHPRKLSAVGDTVSGHPIRVAIIGVGNCATSLIQGVEYYKDADAETTIPGLMHVEFGPYHVNDVEFVAAFDVDAKKVGLDLSEAITASENNTIK